MDLNQILSWVISILALIGVYSLTKKKRVGWIVYFFAQVLSMYLYYLTELWGLFFVNIIFVFLSIKGYYEWKEDRSKEV